MITHYHVDGYVPACATFLKDKSRATRHLDIVTCKSCLRVVNQNNDPKWVRILGTDPRKER